VRAAFPDFHNEVSEVVANGDRAAVRLRCTGRHDGELFGIAPTGLLVAYEAAAFLRSRDTQLSAAWVLGDLEHLKRLLGTSAVSS
jgi:predicted ester cyclase